MSAMKVVHVEWIDASAKADWTTMKELLETEPLSPTHSVGLFIKETENSVILALTYDPTTDLTNAIMEIPLACVVNLRTICRVKVK